MPTSKPSSNARFSRKTLNIIIVMTSLMVLMFLNLPGGKKPEEAKTSDPTPLTEGESAALFANSNSNANATAHNQKLQSLDIIASKPVKNHRIDIQSWNTSKGAKVLFVESHEVPMLDIRLVFNAGSARDDALPGVANFVNAMLNEGTENFSVDQIAEKFEGLGANFGNGAYRDMAIASLRTLSDSDYRDKALPLFYEVVTKPAFPETSMERIRKQLLIALEHKKQRPSSTASEAFFKTLYADHPYGSPSDGTETSLGTGRNRGAGVSGGRVRVAHGLVSPWMWIGERGDCSGTGGKSDDISVRGPQRDCGRGPNAAQSLTFPDSQTHPHRWSAHEPRHAQTRARTLRPGHLRCVGRPDDAEARALALRAPPRGAPARIIRRDGGLADRDERRRVAREASGVVPGVGRRVRCARLGRVREGPALPGGERDRRREDLRHG